MFEVWPDAVGQIVRSGHDIAAHGYTQDLLLAHAASPEAEHELIRRRLDVLAERTGKRPEGWLSPVLAWTEHTADFLAQEKVLWQGDANYLDQPRQYHDVYKDTFDYLYANEPMALMVMTMHCHFGGPPLMAVVFDKLLAYFAQFSGVWFARHRELAQWALDSEFAEVIYAQRFFSVARDGWGVTRSDEMP